MNECKEWVMSGADFKVHGAIVLLSHCEALKILVPMDSGRYADVLINITAAILIFFLPGGYTLSLFISLAFSHVLLGD